MAVGLSERRGADPRRLPDVEVEQCPRVLACRSAHRRPPGSGVLVEDDAEEWSCTLAVALLPETPYLASRGPPVRLHYRYLQRVAPVTELQFNRSEAGRSALRQVPGTGFATQVELWQ